LGGLGSAYFSLGQYDHAIDLYEQQLEIAREIGDRFS
jgi:tetratricopeptide (TPR) repeat protein